MWNPFKKNKEEPIKVQPPKPVHVREKLINNGTMKRELNAIRTSSAVRSALGLGASYTGLDINAVINQQLPALMIESRELALNNPIAKKYFTESANAVAGSEGLYLRPDLHLFDNEQDNIDMSQKIEERFYAWSENPELFDVRGELDFSTFQNLLELERSINGEAFVRIHTINGQLRIELIEALRVPVNNNELFDDGRYISNGIEFNKFDKPIAYYFMHKNPLTYTYDYALPERVPADEVLHYFVPQFANQQRGLPDIIHTKDLLKELDSFLEASLVTKKIGSAFMGFIENDVSNNDDTDINAIPGTQFFETEVMEPGAIVELQPGQRVKDLKPSAATDGISEYVDQQMTLISMGLGITKQTLTGDTSNASYSAARLSEKIQQNTFQVRTNQLKVKVLKPLYKLWMRLELLNNGDSLGLRFSDFDKLLSVQIYGQRKISLDPLKDAQYEILMLQNGLKSKAEIIAETRP